MCSLHGLIRGPSFLKRLEVLSRTPAIAGRKEGGSRPPERERIHLTGRSTDYDPRVHAIRPDVADIALADIIFAPHYASPLLRAVTVVSTMLRAKGSEDSPAVSQLLQGETFHVLDEAGGWAWGYCGHDHYVGYIRADALGIPSEPSHFISAREALLFAQPDIKSPPLSTLSLGARVGGTIIGDFLATGTGFVHRRHIAPIGMLFSDPVATAERLLGAPYLWGGRGAGGIDCSGLVQLALSLSGNECPRDSDQQRMVLGDEIPVDASLQRGDLLFFPGHVGFMANDTDLVHANAWWMAVVVEPLRDVIERLRASYDQPILARRRLLS